MPTGALPSPVDQPLTGWLVAGFILLVAGLAVLTVRSRKTPLASPESTRRATWYAVVYALCSACFGRVIGSAILGLDQSPWLLALGDVIFVTLGLYVWVMTLAEGHTLQAFGFRATPANRVAIPLVMGLGAVVYFAYPAYAGLFGGQARVTTDALVFSLLFASVGSALPEEILFRGYLQGSLEGRASLIARIVLPALAFAIMRGARVPGSGFGPQEAMSYILSVALPLGLLWGLMRELAAGTLWPGLISHFLLEFGTALNRSSPASS